MIERLTIEKWSEVSSSQNVTMPVKMRVASNWVDAALDIIDRGFQFRIPRFLLVFVTQELISFVKIVNPGEFLICLRNSTCFEIRIENFSKFTQTCANFDILVIATRQNSSGDSPICGLGGSAQILIIFCA
jgi:hypothetical protein